MTSPVEPQSPTGEVTSSDQNSGTNPAWNDVLSVLPEQFHSVVTPHFQKWDSEAQNRITELNGKVKDFEPFAPLIEHGFTWDQVQQAILLNQEINTNPRGVYDALAEAYKYNEAVQTAVANQGQTDGGNQPNPWEEQYNTLKGQLDTVSQIMLQQEEAKQAATYDRTIDNEINAAMQKFPDVVLDKGTENYILGMALNNNMSIEQAFQNFIDFRNSLAPEPFAPRVMGSQGGGVPSQQIDPTKLSSQETRSLVAQYLEANARANK